MAAISVLNHALREQYPERLKLYIRLINKSAQNVGYVLRVVNSRQ